MDFRYLKPDENKKSKHKTAVKKKTLNPEFNEVDLHYIMVLGILAGLTFIFYLFLPVMFEMDQKSRRTPSPHTEPLELRS